MENLDLKNLNISQADAEVLLRVYPGLDNNKVYNYAKEGQKLSPENIQRLMNAIMDTLTSENLKMIIERVSELEAEKVLDIQASRIKQKLDQGLTLTQEDEAILDYIESYKSSKRNK